MAAMLGHVVDAVERAIRYVGIRIARRKGDRRFAQRMSYHAKQEIDRGRFPTAKYYAECAIAADPTWRDGYRMLGFAYQRQGDPTRARELYERAAGLFPDDAFVQSSIGRLEYELDHLPEAEQAFRRALSLTNRPELLPGFLVSLGLAIAYQGPERQEEAAAVLERARRASPDRAEAAVLTRALGEVYLRQDRFSDALDLLQSEVVQHPGDGRMLYDLGLALKGLGRFSDAIAAMRRATELSPEEAAWRRNLENLERAARGGDAWP